MINQRFLLLPATFLVFVMVCCGSLQSNHQETTAPIVESIATSNLKEELALRVVDSLGKPVPGVIAANDPETCSDVDGMLVLSDVESGGAWTLTHPLYHSLVLKNMPANASIQLQRKSLELKLVDGAGKSLTIAGRVEILDGENRYLGGGRIPGYDIKQSHIPRELRFYGGDFVGVAVLPSFANSVSLCVTPPVSVRFFLGDEANLSKEGQVTKVTLHHFAEGEEQVFRFEEGQSLVSGLIPQTQYLYSIDGGHVGQRVLLAPRIDESLDVPVFSDSEIYIPLPHESLAIAIHSVRVTYEFGSHEVPFEIRGQALVLRSSAIDRRILQYARIEAHDENGSLLATSDVRAGTVSIVAVSASQTAPSKTMAKNWSHSQGRTRKLRVGVVSPQFSYFSLRPFHSKAYPPIFLPTNQERVVRLPFASRYKLEVGPWVGDLKLSSDVEKVAINLDALAPMERPFVARGSGDPLKFCDVVVTWRFQKSSQDHWGLSFGAHLRTNGEGYIEEALREGEVVAGLVRSWQSISPSWGFYSSSLGGGGLLPPSILAQFEGVPVTDDPLEIEKRNGKNTHFYGKRTGSVMPEVVPLTQGAAQIDGVVDPDELRKFGRISGLRPGTCPGGWSAVGIAELPYLYVSVGDRTLEYIGRATETPYGLRLDIDYSKLPKGGGR